MSGGGSNNLSAPLTLCIPPLQASPWDRDPQEGWSPEDPEQVGAHPGPGAGELGGSGGGSAAPGAGGSPCPCPQDGTLLYSFLLAHGQQDAAATFTAGFQARSYQVGASGWGQWVLSLGVLGSCGLGPWMMWLFTAIPCGLCANVPCS